MGIFGDIMSKSFGQSAKAETPGASSATPPTSTPPPPMAAPTGSIPAGRTAPPPASTAPSSAAPQATVDIKAVLRDLAKSKKQKLNYEKSIVDLLKLLDLDSSATARKELATELGYSGDTKSSSKMNVWLHKQVMIKLAANGGKVPKEWMD